MESLFFIFLFFLAVVAVVSTALKIAENPIIMFAIPWGITIGAAVMIISENGLSIGAYLAVGLLTVFSSIIVIKINKRAYEYLNGTEGPLKSDDMPAGCWIVMGLVLWPIFVIGYPFLVGEILVSVIKNYLIRKEHQRNKRK